MPSLSISSWDESSFSPSTASSSCTCCGLFSSPSDLATSNNLPNWTSVHPTRQLGHLAWPPVCSWKDLVPRQCEELLLRPFLADGDLPCRLFRAAVSDGRGRARKALQAPVQESQLGIGSELFWIHSASFRECVRSAKHGRAAAVPWPHQDLPPIHPFVPDDVAIGI